MTSEIEFLAEVSSCLFREKGSLRIKLPVEPMEVFVRVAEGKSRKFGQWEPWSEPILEMSPNGHPYIVLSESNYGFVNGWDEFVVQIGYEKLKPKKKENDVEESKITTSIVTFYTDEYCQSPFSFDVADFSSCSQDEEEDYTSIWLKNGVHKNVLGDHNKVMKTILQAKGALAKETK